MYVKYDKKLGIVEYDSGKQLLQITAINCSQKFRDMAAKNLVNILNNIERGKQKDSK